MSVSRSLGFRPSVNLVENSFRPLGCTSGLTSLQNDGECSPGAVLFPKETLMKAKMPVYGAVPVALLLESSLTLADLRVYTALSSFQGNHEDAYPSREQIADRCGIALETISRAVAHLVDLGWVYREQRGQNKTNVYRVMIEVEPVSEVTATSHPGNDGYVTPEVTATSHPSIRQKTHLKRTVTTDPLYAPLKASFESKSTFTNYPKETANLKRLCKAIRTIDPEYPEDLAKKMLEQFDTMIRTEKSTYWKTAPFLPSTMVARFDQILAAMKQHEKVYDISWVDRARQKGL